MKKHLSPSNVSRNHKLALEEYYPQYSNAKTNAEPGPGSTTSETELQEVGGEGDPTACEGVTSEVYWYHPNYLEDGAKKKCPVDIFREHPDRRSVDMVTDISGEVYQYFLYNAWGENMYTHNSYCPGFDSPYRFNGKELDPETGLHYYGARYYANKTSIWLSVDPMSSSRAWLTPYNFVQNNPIMRIDPTGMLDEDGGGGGFWNWVKSIFSGGKSNKDSAPQGSDDETLYYGEELEAVEITAQNGSDLGPRELAEIAPCEDCPLYTGGPGMLEYASTGGIFGSLKSIRDGYRMWKFFRAKKTVDAARSGIQLTRTRFGHTFAKHGEDATSFLANRAKGSGTPQGQFLDNQKAAQFILDNVGKTANGAVNVPIPKGFPARVIMPDRTFKAATHIRLVPGGGGVKTAYPLIP